MSLHVLTSPSGIRWACRALAVLLCGLHAWVARHVLSPDGLSYLDMADAYARGDLGTALNTYWSPLYSWLLGATLTLLRPSPYWECAVAHGLNFVIFLGALAAFEWFLTELLRAHDDMGGTIPTWALTGLAYTLFIWTSRRLVTVSYVTPDMTLSALVYLAAALLLRTRRLGPAPVSSALLGVVLGAAYLTKAIMFPLGFVFLAGLGLASGNLRKGARHAALAGLCFLVVAGCFIGALSQAKGRLTFGDSGRLNYAWYVNGVPRFHWSEGNNPPRKLVASPAATYDLVAPVGGTYPYWYDPAYWYDGVRTELNLSAQFKASVRTAGDYVPLLFRELLGFTSTAGLLFLLALLRWRGTWADRWQTCRTVLLRCAPVLLPALAAVLLYLLVGHVEGRLIGPFLLLILASALAAVRAPAAGRIAGAALLLIVLALGRNLLYDASNAVRSLRVGEGPTAHPAAQVAGYLQRRGLREGHGVASIGYTYDAYWARLGGYRVIAEVPEGEHRRFWQADQAAQDVVLGALRRTGARAIVAGPLPHAPAGWARVPGTNYFVYEREAKPRQVSLTSSRRQD